ncbi:hypothetical protein Noca_1600 [Nocardioides sp. JS614]|nr:hypothetical protein Noca_1600 [Nocardioides sp. JS614]
MLGHAAPSGKRKCRVRRSADAARAPVCGGRGSAGAGAGSVADHGDRDAEVAQPVLQVLVQTHRERVFMDREHDLVDRLRVQHVLQGVHRVVLDRDRADHVASGGPFELWQCRPQHLFCRGCLVVAFGVEEVDLGAGRVRDDDTELCRGLRRPLLDRLEQLGVGVGRVGDD